MNTSVDLTDLKIGRWLVLSAAPKHASQRQWNVVCECGTVTRVLDCNLRRGLSKQCGTCRHRFGPMTDVQLPVMRLPEPEPVAQVAPILAGRENGAPLPPMHPVSWGAISQHVPCLADAISSTGTTP